MSYLKVFVNIRGYSWKGLFYSTYKTDENKLISLGNMYAKTLIKSFKNNFWNDTLSSYSEFQSKGKSENINDILTLPLWYNDMIIIENKSIFKNKIEKGIRYINDMFNEYGNLYNCNEFCNQYDVNLPVTCFYGIRRSILVYYSKLSEIRCNLNTPFLQIQQIKHNTNYITKWMTDLQLLDNNDDNH